MTLLDVTFAPAAKRELKKLGRGDVLKIMGVIESLASCPRPRGMEKIQGHPKFYRIAAGKNHRVIYHILQERLVVILLVRDRKDAYKSLDDLDGKLAVALQQIEREVMTSLKAASA